MKIEELRPKIRFADCLEYIASRPPSRTYDCRLLYVKSGAGIITVDSQRYRITPGLLVIFCGGVTYSFSPTPSFLAYAVDFDLNDEYETDAGFLLPVPVRLFDPAQLHAVPLLENSDLFSAPYVACQMNTMGERIDALVDTFCSKKRFGKARAELMLAEFFLYLEDGLEEKSKGAACVAAIMDYIDAHYPEKITNSTIACLVGYEPCYLGRVIKQHTGDSIHGLLVKKRVHAGISLLLTTDLTLDAIAERVGFCSAAHFSRKCKEMTGNNPSKYRKN